MSVRRNTIKYGAAAAVLALVVIAGSVFFISSQTNTIQIQGNQGNQGQLDVLLTDPPSVPNGVTAIYVTYGSVAVHVSGAGNQSGWTSVDTTGTINLMGLVNVSTTIAAVKVTSGVYNALRFNITSADVTYNGKNYTAFVPRAELTVAIPGGIKVSAANTSAAVIDMYPTVVNIGSESTPEFIVDTTASCFGVPPSAVTKGMGQWGFRMPLNKTSWWTNSTEQYTSAIQVTDATLNSSYFSVTVKNTGSEDVNLSTVSVMPVGSECAYPLTASTTTSSSPTSPTSTTHNRYDHGQYRMPLCFTGSAFFAVLSNGTLKSASGWRLGGITPQFMLGSEPTNIFADMGYKLATGQSVTLTFSGSIAFGFSFQGPTPLGTPPGTTAGVVSGDQYDITVVGQQALAQYTVVAS
jgi:hypothetical protein